MHHYWHGTQLLPLLLAWHRATPSPNNWDNGLVHCNCMGNKISHKTLALLPFADSSFFVDQSLFHFHSLLMFGMGWTRGKFGFFLDKVKDNRTRWMCSSTSLRRSYNSGPGSPFSSFIVHSTTTGHKIPFVFSLSCNFCGAKFL